MRLASGSEISPVIRITSRSGEYVFRFPYANSGSPGAVKVGAVYRFECRGDVGSLAIDEAAVMGGGTLPGPDLCLSGRK